MKLKKNHVIKNDVSCFFFLIRYIKLSYCLVSQPLLVSYSTKQHRTVKNAE